MPTRAPILSTTPDSTDGPVLLALLIGAKRAGDKVREQHTRGLLEQLGIKITFATNAPAIRPRRKVVAHG